MKGFHPPHIDNAESLQSPAIEIDDVLCQFGRIRALAFLVCLACSLTAPGALAQLPQNSANAITPPTVVVHRDADYPEAARTARLQGTVILVLTVSRGGAVEKVEVTQSVDKLLDEAAIEAVKAWTFTPALRDGVPAAAKIRVPFRFELPSASVPTENATQTGEPADEMPTFESSPEDTETTPIVVQVTGTARRERNASDFVIEVGQLENLPLEDANDVLQLAPGLVVANEGGPAMGQMVILRGISADEGQNFEFSVDGVPINESGNIDVHGFSDLYFIIPELVQSLHVAEGTFDPRQGNYAVGGSIDYKLGLRRRGMTARYTLGSWNTQRMLFMWGPPGANTRTYTAGEVYKSDGFGQNRSSKRASAMTQYEMKLGKQTVLRVAGQAYTNYVHSAGLLRADDVAAGRIGLYDSYDPRQGGDTSRYSVAGTLEMHGPITVQQQVYLIQRDMELRENFTGFTEDPQQDFQQLHPQRGDMVYVHSSGTTFGAKGFASTTETVRNLPQSLELGYFARGDHVSGTIQRIGASTNEAYQIDGSLKSMMGDVGLYADAYLRPFRYVALRGGARADLFTFDVLDRCAVPNASSIPSAFWPNDGSCLSMDESGNYRDPNRRTLAAAYAVMPRTSLVIGPWKNLTATFSYGVGGRSADPVSVIEGVAPLFAKVESYEGGVSYSGVLRGVKVNTRSQVFHTNISEDTVFSETAGRVIPTQGTMRTGWLGSLRFTGSFFDEWTSLTLTRAIFDDTRLPVPFTPTSVFRSDSIFFGQLGRFQGRIVRGAVGGTVAFIGPRPLPYSQMSDSKITIDARASLRWSAFELMLGSKNLLDSRYKLGEWNYVSEWNTQTAPTLAPQRHFSAGAPRFIFLTLGITLGEGDAGEPSPHGNQT
jgi:iron complex outermembrane recepter protein